MTVKNKLMGQFAAQKVEHLLVFMIPSELAVKAGERFNLVVEDNGRTLIYQRVASQNSWDNGNFAAVDFGKEIADVGNADSGDYGREYIDQE